MIWLVIGGTYVLGIIVAGPIFARWNAETKGNSEVTDNDAVSGYGQAIFWPLLLAFYLLAVLPSTYVQVVANKRPSRKMREARIAELERENGID